MSGGDAGLSGVGSSDASGVNPLAALFSGGLGGLDFSSASSSSTGPISTSGVRLSRGIDPVFIWIGLGLAAVWLFKGK